MLIRDIQRKKSMISNSILIKTRGSLWTNRIIDTISRLQNSCLIMGKSFIIKCTGIINHEQQIPHISGNKNRTKTGQKQKKLVVREERIKVTSTSSIYSIYF